MLIGLMSQLCLTRSILAQSTGNKEEVGFELVVDANRKPYREKYDVTLLLNDCVGLSLAMSVLCWVNPGGMSVCFFCYVPLLTCVCTVYISISVSV